VLAFRLQLLSGWTHDPGNCRGAYWARQSRCTDSRQDASNGCGPCWKGRRIRASGRLVGRMWVRGRRKVDELDVWSCVGSKLGDIFVPHDPLGENNEARKMDVIDHATEMQLELTEQTPAESSCTELAAIKAGEIDSILPDRDARTGRELGIVDFLELFLVRIVVVVNQV
jgi:hypothetical protein